MQNGEEATLSIAEFFDMAEKDGGLYEIDTPDGWVKLGALVKKSNKECYILHTESGKSLGASSDHYVETNSGWVVMRSLIPGEDSVVSMNGMEAIVALEYIGGRDTFDFEVLHNNHRYYSNGISSHNTGKTAFTRALGQELNMPIISFDLSTMTNQDFISAWEESMSRTPCITLFEDIDGVFNGRENVATKGSMNSGLTFDCLLNTLDGVQNTDGCFIVVTTNCIEHVDRAIGIPSNGDDVSSRPGRIDRVINFVPLSTEGKEKMANRILGGFPENKWKHLITEAKDRTGAQFQDMCSRLALKLFWEGKKEHTT